MYDATLADIYDRIYRGRGKDYAAEADEIARVARSRRPSALSLLDVACGTGTHLAHFATRFDSVAGLELSEEMLVIAKRRLQDVPLHLADMRDFDLGRSFDVITCLFSSIGHMETTDELDTATARMAAHLEPGGVLVIEPWWFPDTFTPGYVGGAVVRDGETTIARMSYSERVGDRTRMEVHYLVGETDEGVRHASETMEITLFTRDQYEAAFVRAGCAVEFVEGGPSGRGLFVGVRPDGAAGADR